MPIRLSRFIYLKLREQKKGIRIGERGIGNVERGIGNSERRREVEHGYREQGTESRELGTENREQGAGNKERGTGNIAKAKRQKAKGNRKQFIVDGEWRTRKREYREKLCLYRYFSRFFGERQQNNKNQLSLCGIYFGRGK